MYFFTNATVTSCWPFFIFFITFGGVQQQSNSKPTQKWWQNEKKWATGQICICKEETSYKIHTLDTYKKKEKIVEIESSFFQ